MPVAKTYSAWEQSGESFIVSGRAYVNVKNPKDGKIKQVRWYSEKEYAKMYPDALSAAPGTSDPCYKPQKDVLGFSKGPITIFRGDTYAHLEWFQLSIARYARGWGWYIPSELEVPEDIPEGIEPVRLHWEIVGTGNGTLKSEKEVQEAVDLILYPPTGGEFVGQIGERLELYLTVDKAIALEGYYGHSTMHIMHDDSGNEYTWTTAAKCWPSGSEHHIRGTVKEHKVYKGVNQNVLTRCSEI